MWAELEWGWEERGQVNKGHKQPAGVLDFAMEEFKQRIAQSE